MAQYPNHPPVYHPYYPPPPPYYPPPPPATYPAYPTAQPQAQQPAGKYYPHQQQHHATPYYQPPPSPATHPAYPTSRPHAQPQSACNSYPHQQPSGSSFPHQHQHAGHAAPYYPAYQPPPPNPAYCYPNPLPPVYCNPQPQVRPVVGAKYCIPHPVDLVIVRKVLTLTDDFIVRDVNKNVLFKAKGKILTLHDNRLLSDATGKPVMTLRLKILTAHSRWQVYKGDSSEARDLVFTAKTSSMVQFKTKLNVYLAGRTSEDVCDYRVKGSLTKGSCVVYVGDSETNIAAKMQTKSSVQSVVLGKDKFMVTVSPNIDYAFVVGLIVILDAIINAADVIKAAVLAPVQPIPFLL